MRRKDREMDIEFGKKIIDKSKYGILSMINMESEPHGLPLSIVRDGDILYFHSSMDGEKVEIFANNNNLSVTFVGNVKVPEIYTNEELDEIVKDESKYILLISKVFTTEFESAIVTGKLKKVEDLDEKIEAMRVICNKYTPSKMKYFDMAIKAGLKRTNVYKIEIKNITAKRKKYDSQGNEIKNRTIL